VKECFTIQSMDIYWKTVSSTILQFFLVINMVTFSLVCWYHHRSFLLWATLKSWTLTMMPMCATLKSIHSTYIIFILLPAVDLFFYRDLSLLHL
jgi:hypothetical protein